MKILKTILIICITFILYSPNSAFSSSVKIFSDLTYYFPDLKSNFIGFNKDIKVFCGSSEIGIEERFYVNENCYLCDLYNSIKQLKQQKDNLRIKELILENLVNNLKPKEETFLKTYSDISTELVKINSEKNKVLDLYYTAEEKFKNHAKSKNPIFLMQNCTNPSIKIKNAVNSDFNNVLKILSINKIKGTAEIEVSKILTLRNNSGIDIVADKADIFFKKSKLIVDVPDESIFSTFFTPAELDMLMPGDTVYSKPGFFKGSLSDEPKETKKKDRVYFIENLNLPANGLKKLFKIEKAKLNADYSLVVFPKYNSNVYKRIIFELPFQIDTHVWEVEADDELLTKLYSDFKDNKHILYAGIDYTVVVERKPINFKHKNVGFFNKKVKIKLGYKINIFNNSKETKKIQVIDRVPFFEYDIKTKNVSISNPNCKMDKYGKITCDLQLEPNGKYEIVVKYELITDKKTYEKYSY